ncbi:MAG TPA: three-Cys-motif partner protein TcmP [Candidatus Cybelea sp.]|nr:three-Cys-motif partner protein TcmP [Candidatus Cybelea sp.]
MSRKVVRARKKGQLSQAFGGPWSLIKTDVVEQYLKFFNTALKNQQFKRLYIDAFAGSGAFENAKPASTDDLFGPPQSEIHSGSAQRALNVAPPFDELIFIEHNKDNVAALQDLAKKSKHPNVRLEKGDANVVLRTICGARDWKATRGVIFLDPFGMNVEWETLKRIADTRALDVWYLFALAGLVRNLPVRSGRLDSSKRAAVTRVLGTNEWYDRLYAPSRDMPLFEETPSASLREASVDQIEAYVKERLGVLFPFVASPLRLRTQKNSSLFSLFFAVSNPSTRAKELAQRAVPYLLKMA